MGPAHLEALRRLNVAVRGILDITPEKSRQAADKMGLLHGYADLAALLADESVQAVHVTSPNRWHHEHVLACLDAGKHVLCEKPLAMNSTQSAELAAKAAATDRVCAVNYNMRFYPLCLEARERVRGGQIGRVHAIQGSYVQDWLLFPTDYNWRVLADEGGSLRAVADIGTHWLDLVHSITGLEVAAVFAELTTVHKTRLRPMGEVVTFKSKESGAPPATEPIPITTDDIGAILFRFQGGATGVLWVSQVTAGRKNRLTFEISGASNALFWDSESPNALWIGSRTAPNQVLVKDPSLVGDLARTSIGYPGGHDEGYPDSFKHSFKAFYAAIRGEAGGPYATFADGHREVVLCEAIQRSADLGQWVSVS